MRKTLVTILCSALLAASSIQVAAAAEHPAEHHNVRKTSLKPTMANERFRNANNEQLRYVAARSRSHLNPNVDGYASSSYNGVRGVDLPAVRPVSPGDPGNPYLNDPFDRAVERHEYNGS
jgi:hypothetical protein